MGIALHPYLVGQPHRLRALRVALEHVARARDAGSIWLTTPGEICAHVALASRGRHAVKGGRKAVASAPAAKEDDATRIYRTIFEAVMSQRLAPGTRLAEVALCELFGVGRTVVRKVLQELAHDHIVDLKPNRGATVAAPTPGGDARDLRGPSRARGGAAAHGGGQRHARRLSRH